MMKTLICGTTCAIKLISIISIISIKYPILNNFEIEQLNIKGSSSFSIKIIVI